MKKAVMILLTMVLVFSSTVSPVFCVLAQENAEETDEGEDREDGEGGEQSLLERGAELGSDLYQKMDDAVENMDRSSLRRDIREALEEMDEIGISPSAIAEKLFGIRTGPSGKAPGGTLIEDAKKTVSKKTEGFFTILWNGFLDTLEGIITTGISVFGDRAEENVKGGISL